VTRTPPCAESRAPVPRVARRGSSRRLVSSACQTAWGGATGGKKKTSIPLNRRAGSLSRGQSGARRATIRARALTSRVTANVPRAFRATGWVCRPVGSRLDGWSGSISGRTNDIFARRDELSLVASLAFRVYFLTDRHSRLMANCVKTRQILTEEPCTGCFSFSTRGCDGDFENENFKGSRRICASFAVHVTARAGRRPARREPDPARVPHRAPTRARRSSTRDPRSRGPGLTRSSHNQPLKKRRGDGGG